MRRARGWPRSRRGLIVVSMALLLPGCERDDAKPDRQHGLTVTATAVVGPPSVPQPMPSPTEGSRNLAEGQSSIQRVDPDALRTATPTVTTPIGRLPTRKNFVDPPLPTELRDDGGLTPLPKPPARNTDR